MKNSNRIIAGIFIIFLFLSLVVNIVLPDNLYSESEKRELDQMPDFTLDTVISGDFTSKFDKYASDQFFGRDTWVFAKGLSQYLIGQKKLNGVYITEDRYIRELVVNKERLENNLDAILKLAEKSGKPVTLLVVPEASTIYEDNLPLGETSKENHVIDRVYEKLGGKINIVYPKDILQENKDEYIYFNGDHHWTMKGAYYAYSQMTGTDKAYNFITVADDFKGTMVTKAGVKLPWIPHDKIEVPEEITNDYFAISVNRDGSDADGEMFYPEFLGEFDKYRYFQGGDQPLMAIGSVGKGTSFVLKDSFANVMLPYLALDNEVTYVADTRYNRQSPSEYAKTMNVDEIILIYSPDSLCNEFSLVNLGN